MLISPCGVNCEGCQFAESCGGSCNASEGKPFYLKDFGMDICSLYDCAVNKKGYKTCSECSELPCKLYYDWKDPSMTDEAHIQSVNDRVNILKGLKN